MEISFFIWYPDDQNRQSITSSVLFLPLFLALYLSVLFLRVSENVLEPSRQWKCLLESRKIVFIRRFVSFRFIRALGKSRYIKIRSNCYEHSSGFEWYRSKTKWAMKRKRCLPHFFAPHWYRIFRNNFDIIAVFAGHLQSFFLPLNLNTFRLYFQIDDARI